MPTPRKHYAYVPPGRVNRKWPFADMAIGDYLIDRSASIDGASARHNSPAWRWRHSPAYDAAMAYQRKHPEYLFTGRVEHDSTGQAIGVRITREHPALRDVKSMLAYLRDHVGHDAWKQGRKICRDTDGSIRYALINLREFTRQYMEHPLL